MKYWYTCKKCKTKITSDQNKKDIKCPICGENTEKIEETEITMKIKKDEKIKTIKYKKTEEKETPENMTPMGWKLISWKMKWTQ